MKQKTKVKLKANPWQVHLKKVYEEMKVKNKSIKLSDAMKKAKLSYKKTCK